MFHGLSHDRFVTDLIFCRRPRKKLWQDEGRWSHDKYSDKMQAPKSREELITEYGHDIRLSDKPPDAPPRRGGGPR